jgi:lipoprotein-anchoring transpeptidase ErfK/SrfK
MTDIYINRSHGRRKTLLLIAGTVLLLAGGIWRWTQKADPEASPESSASTNAIPVTTGTTSTTPAPSQPAPSLDEVKRLMQANEWQAARETASSIQESISDPLTRRPVERLLGEIHTRLVFSTLSMPEKITHQIKPGDTLGALAQKYGSTTDRIATSNGIQNNLIRVGDRLKILQGDFRVEVSKSRNEMEVYFNDRFFKRYLVGTGTDSSTPAGEYVITLRMKHPVWYRPDGQRILYGDPENLLGTHYLKLNTPGIGIHGTWEPKSVGSQSSAGCVRLINEEIQELYNLLPEGTPVIITD